MVRPQLLHYHGSVLMSLETAGGQYAKVHVPEGLRYIISAESAANDGLAYPFLSISIYQAMIHARYTDCLYHKQMERECARGMLWYVTAY